MENIEENIENIKKQIEMLNDFITLSLRRHNICKELDQINVNVNITQDLLTKAHILMQQQFNTYKHEYEEIMSEMRKKQLIVMEHIIKEKHRKINEDKREEESINSAFNNVKLHLNSAIPQSAVKLIGHNFAQFALQNSISVTPKIKICEYKQSPLIKKKLNLIPFEFEEFDVTITEQQFNTIPKYMCGRETLEQLNSFLHSVVIPCFNEKYKLIHKPRSCIKNPIDLELWKLYNDQASYLPGRTFITQGDLNRKTNKMLDKKALNRLVILRHIGILSEIRIKQTIFYTWSSMNI